MQTLDYSLGVKIQHRAEAIAKAMVKIAALKQHEPDSQAWGEYIYAILSPEFERQAQNLDFYQAYYAPVVSIAGQKYINDIYSAKEEAFCVYFLNNMNDPRKPWPRHFHIDGLATITNAEYAFLGGYLILHDNPVWYELRDEIMAYNALVKRYADQRRTLIDGVEKICAHYATVNGALAAWPALRFLLPEDLQTQDFPFDGAPRPLPDGVDIAELTAMVTRAKLEV